MVCHVYIWYDKYRPFYVGIGGDNRLKSPKRNKQATSRRKRAETSGTFKQEVVLSGSRKNCSEVEKLLIYTYGSVSKGGLLFNFTEGGDGGDTFSAQTPERKEEIVRKIKENQDPEVRKKCGQLGGAVSAKVNKERGNGPWDPDWVKKGTTASVKNRFENPDEWREISIKGAQSSWIGELGDRHREINAASCSKVGKKNKGKRWVNNGIEEKTISGKQTTPEGFSEGRLKRKWINDGVTENQVLDSSPTPQGFSLGRLPRS
jgi:hypothetical protein